jgi:hypothetical protein
VTAKLLLATSRFHFGLLSSVYRHYFPQLSQRSGTKIGDTKMRN